MSRPTPAEDGCCSGAFAKRLHVSPFMPMDHEYALACRDAGRRLAVHIESRERGRRAFDATLALRRRERARVPRALARYPRRARGSR